MAIEKVIDIKVQGNADQAVGSLRSQLREAQADVAALSDKFGATSNEAINAAKRAGELKDKIGDAKALTDAFNPDAKFKALSSSLGGVAGGFAAVQGSMALFGAQSEDVEKTLLKVQSAMALSQGLQSVGESVDSFKQLGAVVKSYSIVQKISTAAQLLWNAAMSANPLGLIVVAITAVIAAGYVLIKYFQDVTVSSKVAMQGIKDNSRALEESERITKKHNSALKENNDYQYNMAKASGASAEELRKLSLKQADSDISLKLLNRTIAQNTYYRELNSLATLKSSGANEEAIKAQDALVKKSLESFANENKALTESVNNKKLLIQKNNVEIRQEHTSHNEKLKSDADAAKTKKDEEDKAKAKQYLEETKNGLNELRQAEFDNNVQKSTEKRDLLDEQIALLNEGVDAVQEAETATTAVTAEQTAARIKLAELEKKGKLEAADAVANTLSGMADLLGKETAAGKAAAVASATINTFSSAQKAYDATVGIPYVGPVLAPINAGIAIMAGIKNVKSILAVKVPGGGGGGSAPTAGGAAGAAATAPQFNMVGNTGVNQLAQTLGQEQPPIKTYVTAGDVTTGQSLNRNIITNASLG